MEKRKKISIEVTNCSDCPYSEYDPNYGMSYDSGYDCTHEDSVGRIINDWEWDNTNNKNRLNLTHDSIPIPGWCPLEDVSKKAILNKKLNKIKN